MKLGHWVQAWREGRTGSDPAGPPSPLAAVLTDAAATLRHVLETLPPDAVSPGARAADARAGALEAHLSRLVRCGATLGCPPLEHTAGQMRQVWRSIREGTLTLDDDTLSAMRACIEYFMEEPASDRYTNADGPEVAQWADAYRSAMARQKPSTAPAPSPPVDPGPPAPVPGPDVSTSDAVSDAEASIPAMGEEADNGPGAREIPAVAVEREPESARTQPQHATQVVVLPTPIPALAASGRPTLPVEAAARPQPGAVNADELERLLLHRTAPAAP